MATFAPEPGYYAVAAAVWATVAVAGYRAKRWYKDKNQMYTYTVALDTPNGTIEVYASTNRSYIRSIVSAINHAIKVTDKMAEGIRPPTAHKIEKSERGHNARHRHRARRPDALPKVKKRY